MQPTIWINLTLLPFLLFIHVFMSWALPSEGEEMIFPLIGLFVVPVLAIMLQFKKKRSNYLKLFQRCLVATFLIVSIHVFYGEYTRKVWPWTELIQKVERECKDAACNSKEVIEYEFPLIGRKVSISPIGHLDNAETEAAKQSYIGVWYSKERWAEFNRELECYHVD